MTTNSQPPVATTRTTPSKSIPQSNNPNDSSPYHEEEILPTVDLILPADKLHKKTGTLNSPRNLINSLISSPRQYFARKWKSTANAEINAPVEEEKKKNEAIEKEIKKEKREVEKEVKLLLWGDASRAMVLKMIKAKYELFTPKEIETFKHIIKVSIIDSIKEVLKAHQNLKVPFEKNENKEKAAMILQLDSETTGIEKFPLIIHDIEAILNDQGVKATYFGHEIDVYQYAFYFFKEIPRISQVDWNPSFEDILYAKNYSQGVQDIKFDFDRSCYRLVYVHAQGDMDKWIHHFEDASAILFCVDVSRYDEFLEDRYRYTDNPIRGALHNLADLTRTEWFMKTPVIILFTNTKLFSEKLHKKSLSHVFADYQGNDYASAIKFLEKKFQTEYHRISHELRSVISRSLYFIEVEVPTDVQSMSNDLWRAVRDIVLLERLQQDGLT